MLGMDTGLLPPDASTNPQQQPGALDPGLADAYSSDALKSGPISRPLPGIAHGTIPGILGIITKGIQSAQHVLGGGDQPSTPPGNAMPAVAQQPGDIGMMAGWKAPQGALQTLQGQPVPGANGGSVDSPASTAAVPLPPSRPSSAPGAETTEPGAPPQGGGGLPQGSLIDRVLKGVGDWRDQNRLTLMALAGGLAGSQSWGQGIGRAFTAAVPAQMADIQLNRINQTAQYLAAHGMDPGQARVVANNPQLMQQTLGQMMGLEPPKTMTLQGPMGSSMVQWNPQTRSWERPNIGGGGGATSAGNLPGNWDTMSEQEKLGALDPVTRGMVQTLHEGGALPPSRFAYTMGIAKQIWPGFTEQDYNAQKQLTTDLEKNNPSSTGGNLLKGMSTFGHVADWAEDAARVGGFSGYQGPGGTLAGKIATGAQRLTADPRLTSNLAAENKSALRAGQEATSFYSQAGGSEGERTANMVNSTGTTVTPAQKAGSIRSEVQLMQTKVNTLLQKVLSNPAGQRFFNRPENQAMLQTWQSDIARAKHSLATLDPTGPEAAEEKARGAGGPAAPAPSQAPVTQTLSALPQGIRPEDALAQARQAIAQGKDRNLVIQRLRSMGVDTTGL